MSDLKSSGPGGYTPQPGRRRQHRTAEKAVRAVASQHRAEEKAATAVSSLVTEHTRGQHGGAYSSNYARGAAPTGGPGRAQVTASQYLYASPAKDIQKQLRRAGYSVPVDGKWDARTDKAWASYNKSLQNSRKYDYLNYWHGAPQGEHARTSPFLDPKGPGPRGERGRNPGSLFVTEHTHGQAHRALDTRPAAEAHGMPAMYGQSTGLIRGGEERAPHDARTERIQRRRAANWLRAHPDPTAPIAKYWLETEKALGELVARNAATVLHPESLATKQGRKNAKTAGLTDIGVTKAIAGQLRDDFTQRDRVGYAALDLFGLPSLATNVALRGAQGVRAVREVEAARAALAAPELAAPGTSAIAAQSKTDAAIIAARQRPILPPRTLTVDGGTVHIPQQSPNPLTAILQHKGDRISERFPEAPGIGARSRSVGHIREHNMTRDRRIQEKAIPLALAHKKIRKLRGVSPEEMAYTVIGHYGYTEEEGVAFLEDEIAQKVEEAAQMTGKARETLDKRIVLLRAARDAVRSPSKNLQDALGAGKALTEDVIEPSKLARGFTTAETMADAKTRHIFFTETGMTRQEYEALTQAQKDLLETQHADEMANLTGRERRANRTAEKASAERARTAKLDTKMTALRERLAVENARLGHMMEHGYVTSPRRANATSEALPLVRQQELVGGLQKQYDRAANAYMKHQSNGGATAKELGSKMAEEQKALAAAKEQATVEHYARINQTRKPTIEQGPHGFNIPDIERTTKDQKKPLRTFGNNPPRPTKAKESHLVLDREGRNIVGPEATQRDFQREAQHMSRQGRLEEQAQYETPFDPDTFDNKTQYIVDRQHQMNLERGSGQKIADEKRRAAAAPTDELAPMTPEDWIRSYVKGHDEWKANTYYDDINKVPADHLDALTVVDKKIGDAFSGLDIANAPTDFAPLKVLDFLNDANRTALIYLTPLSYGIVQGMGNALYYSLQAGPFGAAKIPRYMNRFGKLTPEFRNKIALETGGGAASSLAHTSHGTVFTKPGQHLADFSNLLADKYPRAVSWMHEADRRGFNTPAKIEKLFTDAQTDKAAERTLNEIGESAQQAMVKFRRVPTKYRNVIGRAIFIAPWIEGSTRWLGRFALDRPITARVAADIRERIMKRQKDKLGIGKLAAGGFIPASLPGLRGGPGQIPGFNPSALSPFGTPSEVAKAGRELLPNTLGGGGHPAAGGTHLMNMLQPQLGDLATSFLTRTDPYSGYDYPAGQSPWNIFKDQSVGSLRHPAVPAADIIATALRGAGKDRTYQNEHGLGAAARRAVLGSARPRNVVRANAEEKGTKLTRDSLSPKARVEFDWAANLKILQKAGLKQGDWSPVTKKAIKAGALRAQNLRGNKTQQDKLKADLKTAADLGIITAAHAKDLENLYSTKSDSLVSTRRSQMTNEWFHQDFLTGWKNSVERVKEKEKQGG